MAVIYSIYIVAYHLYLKKCRGILLKFRRIIQKIYPVAIPLYLIPISLFYAQFKDSVVFAAIIAIVGLIPIVLEHPDPLLLLKESLRHFGLRNKAGSPQQEQYTNYKKAVEEILKEHNLNFDVKITDSERLNMYCGSSTIFITKGFVNYFPLNDGRDRKKILSILGHEITHKRRGGTFIIEVIAVVIFTLILISIIFILLSGKALSSFIQFYIIFIGLYLLIFYVCRRNELEADKGGFILAKDSTGLVELLKNTDTRKEKSYNIWDKYDELFRLHPNPVNRIRNLERMGNNLN